MCHSFRRGTMQMYQIREANSGGKSKSSGLHHSKGLNHYIPIIYKIIAQLKSSENISVKETLPSFKTPILSSSTCQLSSLPVPTSRGHRQPCCEPSYDSYKWW